jgi:flagellar biogenesis protein FliO
MGQPSGINTGLNTMPSKKPASAAQSKIFESGALILLLLMILGNGRRWLSLSSKK